MRRVDVESKPVHIVLRRLRLIFRLQEIRKMFLDCGLLEIFFAFICAVLMFKLVENLSRSADAAPKRCEKTTRPLDQVESIIELMRERYDCTNICLVISLKSKQQLLKEYVYDALVLLTKRQPMLRAIIAPSSTSVADKHFEVIDGFNMEFTTSDCKACQWQDVWYSFTSSSRGSGLLWRAMLLQEEYIPDSEVYMNTLVIKFSHSSIDGVSCMKFGKQFLDYLNSVADGTLTRESNVGNFDLMPSLCDVIYLRPWPAWQKYLGLPLIWNAIVKNFVRVFKKYKPKCPLYERSPPTFSLKDDQRQRIFVKVFCEDKTLKLVKSCRSKRCTVTGALMAVVHIAFCRLLGQDFPVPARLENCLAINGQRNCKPKPPEEYLGHYALSHNFFMPFIKRDVDFWQFAKEATSMIHNALKQELHIKQGFAIMNAFSAEEICNEFYLSSDPETIMRLSPCNTLSNVGSFDFGKLQDYKYNVHECLFTSIHGKLAGTFFHSITTVNDKLSWIISINRSRVQENKAQQFANFCFNTLNVISEVN